MVKKNDILDLVITGFGNEGEGIGHADGYTLFVAGAVPGDEIKARVLKANKNFGFAKIEEFVKVSPDRRKPICPYFSKCGGCSLLHVDYEAEKKYKKEKVFDCVTRIGKIAPETFEMKPVIGLDECEGRPKHYRNKAQFPVRMADAANPYAIKAGFFAPRSHRIVEINECAIEAPVTSFLLDALKKFCYEYKVKAYDEETGRGIVRHLMTRTGAESGEVGVCLIINAKNLPHADEFVKAMQDGIEAFNKADAEGFSAFKNELKLASVCVNINMKQTNVIMGNKLVKLYGNDYITDKIGNVSFHISPMSFFQVNPIQTVKLYEKALSYAHLTGNEVVWDLYCGIGTISLFLAKKAREVYGVEIIPEAIENARENAKLNGITNAVFKVGAAEGVAEKLPKPDVIVVDPPRKGCDEKLIKTILKHAPERLVYVSCDPGTLARDLRLLCDVDNGGCYKVLEVQPVDQFAGSAHVESVVRLQKR